MKLVVYTSIIISGSRPDDILTTFSDGYCRAKLDVQRTFSRQVLITLLDFRESRPWWCQFIDDRFILTHLMAAISQLENMEPE